MQRKISKNQFSVKIKKYYRNFSNLGLLNKHNSKITITVDISEGKIFLIIKI